MCRQRSLPLGLICLYARSVEDCQVALTHVKVLLLMEPVADHVLVVLDLQILELVLVQELGVELLADDLRAHKVLLEEHQAHLVQDVLRLFSGLHSAKRLHLDLLQKVCSFFSLAVGLLHLGEHFCQARPFNLHKDLALRHLVQSGNELEPLILLETIQPSHGKVHHVRDSPPQLSALLGKHHDVLPKLRPLARIKIELTNSTQEFCG
mmetsp:Transcript_19603/g.29387  ORF Transcript_19603/g.29387 Transcript_19603/m.29387 type:complete len:208 (+) Transcript_19603:73-696(+)